MKHDEHPPARCFLTSTPECWWFTVDQEDDDDFEYVLRRPRFALFAGRAAYAAPGWRCFRGEFDCIGDARAAAELEAPEWWQIVDLNTCELLEGDGGVYGATPDGATPELDGQ